MSHTMIEQYETCIAEKGAVQLAIERYIACVCAECGGLTAGITTIEDSLFQREKLRLRGEKIHVRRLEVILDICDGDDADVDAGIRKQISFLRRYINANEKAIYFRTNHRKGYFDFVPTKREKRRNNEITMPIVLDGGKK
jgi:hypothetical protein